jgi:hypothetical protein
MAGRPRIYESVEELEQKCEEYFAQTEKPAVTGLALFLGFADKTTLYEYRDRPEFSYPIKKALTRIELYHEEGLTENSVTGRIFALKNMGWSDKVQNEITMPQLKPVIISKDGKTE